MILFIVQFGSINTWVVITITGRDILVEFGRWFLFAQGIIVSSNKVVKWKTFTQIAMINFALSDKVFTGYASLKARTISCGTVALILALWSAGIYLNRAWCVHLRIRRVNAVSLATTMVLPYFGADQILLPVAASAAGKGPKERSEGQRSQPPLGEPPDGSILKPPIINVLEKASQKPCSSHPAPICTWLHLDSFERHGHRPLRALRCPR
jgi:hypothetical protein